MKFWKYQGAGNDFVMLDQRETRQINREDTRIIEWLCDRRFGIGADGLILLQRLDGYDFEMVYFNADGRESSMCGNGGRCIAAFAQHLGLTNGKCQFMAIDGVHEALVTEKTPLETWVELKMSDVQSIEKHGQAYVLNTGSPHYVQFVQGLEHLDMMAEGRAVRYTEPFKEKGINVNMVEPQNIQSLNIRTYERGVEAETFACGTGVTASAIAWYVENGGLVGDADIALHAKGGELAVRFHANGDGRFSEIWLCGPAVQVFEGAIEIEK